MKKQLSKYYLFISIATFIAILFVIIQKSYSNLMGPIKTAKAGNLTKPISTEINSQLIDQLEQKKDYSQLDLGDVWYQPNGATPTLVVTPTQSP